MSDYADWISDRDDQNEAGGGAAQPLSEGTQAAPTSSGSGAAAPANAQTAPSTGSTTSSSTGSPSGFVPISSYYNANSDAAKATAGTLSQPAQQAGQKAQDEQTGLQSDFNSGVTKGMGDLGGPVQGLGTTSTFNAPGAANQPTPTSGQRSAITGTQGHKGAAGSDFSDWGVDSTTPAQQAAANPGVSATATQTVNPGQVSTADATKRGQESYTGPASVTDLNGYAQAASDANTAAQNLYALSSQGGRQAMLQQQYAGSPYNQGQASFDSALTGAATNNFAGLQSQYGGLNTNLSNLVGSTTTQADTARDTATANAGAYAAEGHQGDADAAKYASDYGDWLGAHPVADPSNNHGASYDGSNTQQYLSQYYKGDSGVDPSVAFQTLAPIVGSFFGPVGSAVGGAFALGSKAVDQSEADRDKGWYHP